MWCDHGPEPMELIDRVGDRPDEDPVDSGLRISGQGGHTPLGRPDQHLTCEDSRISAEHRSQVGEPVTCQTADSVT